MDGKKILFGAAYYPEYMPYERLDEDMAMMKAAGMNVVRIAESTWSTLEPKEGVFDFSFIDRVCDKAEQEGVSVIIGTPTYAVPAWLVKKEPEIMVLTKAGRAPYGHRQLMDFMHPAFRFHAERVIRRLAEHTAGKKAVIGFQIDNETKYYDNMSEQVQELFVEYLKERFGSTERLNKAFGLAYWSNSIADWEAFPSMRGCVHAGLSGEFDAFRRHLAADYLKWQADIIQEYRREDQFITHNFDFQWKKFGADIAQDGYSYGVQPDMNHYEAAGAVTLAGTDIYHPTQDELTGAEIGFGGDSIRSLKEEPYLVLECQAQAFKYWTPYPGQLRLHAYSHLASGAAGMLYWNWHSIHNGYETYWKGLLSHDLRTNPAYEEACRFGQEWKKLGAETLTIRKQNKIALVVDNRCLTAFRWFPIDKDLSYNDVVRWVYDSLYELNLECDVVDVEALKELGALREKYDMIVTPALYSAEDELIEKLRNFVKDGGVLFSTFKSFVCDRQLSVYPDVQPHGLTECFGISYNQFSEPGTTTVQGQPVRYFMELLHTEGAECLAPYEHKYWGRYAAVTSHSYGKGKAWYMGCYTEKELLKQYLLQAAEAAGIQKAEAEWPVIVRSGINPKGEKVHYLLHYASEEGSFVCPYQRVTDVLTGMEYREGEIIPLRDWDAFVLVETC
ncbi:MAG: cellulase family glycosylhydrolase [Clostridiales bacterium]|mgnify:CR=1 FL=1|nr:cellulase family glycosylhydrolase [Clostridiales bacterium]